jgi:DNA-binding SARP family transcriptional activator/tetratricopeptide (TPR) repeat protein
VGKVALRLLGPPEMRHEGQPVRFHARKALALLAYLAAEHKPRSRGEITTLLWPESDERRGRTALRSALSTLRKTLEDVAESPKQSHLLTDGDSLGIAFGPNLELDLHTLEDSYTLARSNPQPGDLDDDARSETLDRLRAGAEAYRGDFLEGFSLNDAPDFDLWVSTERETWRRCMHLVYDRLSRLQLEGAEAGDAIVTATSWAGHDPLHEEAHRRLMEAQLTAGDRTGVLNTYETFRSVMTRELGTEPGPEMEVLVAHARGGVSLRDTSRLVVPSASRPQTSRVLHDTPFVGRTEELGVLVEGYQAALSKEAGAVVLLGDPGIGKTRLAEEFLLWAREEGADVLEGRPYEAGGRLPYGVLIDALRSRVEYERAPDDLLEDVWLSELSRILPELRERYPDLPLLRSDNAEARSRLFEAITRLVAALAERSPVILFLDDMHWASRASLDVLQYAGRRWVEEGTRVLLVLGLRVEATEALPAPSSWIAELGHALPVRRLVLDPLAAEETLDLVQTLAGRTPEHRTRERVSSDLERFGRWLFEETDGYPLFLSETIKVLIEQGVLATRPGADRGSWFVTLTPEANNPRALRGLLPESVREAIGTQLSRLSTTASDLLVAGAVLGSEFTFQQLLRVAGMEEDKGLLALDEVLASRLIREADPTNGDFYAFSHDKVREVIYTEAGAARRRVFHRRALTALEEEGAPAAQLAHHAAGARIPETAFRHLLDAADVAMAVFAIEDAIKYYERARSLVGGDRGGRRDSRASPPATALEHLHVNLGRAYELVGEWEEAQGTYEDMLPLARELRDTRLEWAALNRLAILAAQRRFDVGRAEALLREALEAAEASGDRTMLGETQWNLAQMTAMKWEPETALFHGRRALSLAREAGFKELEARSLFVLGQAYRFAGQWEECVAHASRAAALCEALGDELPDAGTLTAQFIWAGAPPSKELANRAMESLSLSLLALGEINRGSPRAAVEVGEHALYIAQEINNEWAQTNALVMLSYALWDAGEYGEALRVAWRGREMAGKVQHIAASFILTVLVSTPQTMPGLEEARAVLLEAVTVADRALPRPWKTIAVSKLCANQALAGDWEAARHYALEAKAIRDVAPTRLIFFDFERHHETEALLRGGGERQAREDVLSLGEKAGQDRRFRLVYLRMLAVLDRWDGDFEGAIEHLRNAEVLAEEMDLPSELWQIRAALAELHEASGDEERAECSFLRAAETLRWLADRIDDPTLQANFLEALPVRQVLRR